MAGKISYHDEKNKEKIFQQVEKLKNVKLIGKLIFSLGIPKNMREIAEKYGWENFGKSLANVAKKRFFLVNESQSLNKSYEIKQVYNLLFGTPEIPPTEIKEEGLKSVLYEIIEVCENHW